MAVIHVRALSGGIGTSTFSWCLARELEALLIDQSPHHDGVTWVAGAECFWPRIVGTGDLSPTEFQKFEDGLTLVEGVRLCAGGVPPPSPMIRQIVRSAPSDREIVIDGNETDATDESWLTIVVATNSVPHMRELESVSADFVICSMRSHGLPPSIVSHLYPNALLFKRQRRVDRGLQGGFGIDDHSDVSKCAKQMKDNIRVGSKE